MTPPLVDELQRHSRALRALARSLVGEDRAEDLMQDTAVQALAKQSPARHPGALLRRIAVNLGARLRRGESRRSRREAAAWAARTTADAPSTAAVAQHRETLQQLHTALMALPEQLLGVLLLRYFEDLPPTEIAGRLGLPLPTVKSRLRRALELLRERLARSGLGKDWREGLATAFGIGATRSVAMATGTKLGLGAAAVVVGAAIYSVIATARTADVPPSGSAPGTTAAAALLDHDGRDAREARTDAIRVPMVPESVARAFSPLVRGRCIDESGRPVPGVVVRVTPHEATASGLPSWPGATGTDGLFSVEIGECEGWYAVELHKDGFAPIRGRLPSAGAGGVREVGDVTLLRGVQVSVHVVDSDGLPRPGAEVRLGVHHTGGVPPFEFWPNHVTCDAEGRAVFARVLPGDYSVRIPTERLLDESPRRLQAGEPFRHLELRVDARRNQVALGGTVVDTAGQPIADALVKAIGDGPAHSSRTDAAGRFLIWRAAAGEPRPVAVGAIARDKDEGSPEGEVAWGDDGVRIVLPELAELRVRVVRASTGAPVEDYHLRLQRTRRTLLQGIVHRDEDLTPSHHEGGITALRVHRSTYGLQVLPADAELRPSAIEEVIVDGDAALPLEIRLPDAVTRTLQVSSAAGSPVPGCAVEVLRASERTSMHTHAVPAERWFQFQVPDKALLVQQGTTDADGRLSLRAPAGLPLFVRLPGPGCVPTSTRVDDLAKTDVLHLQVEVGGRIEVQATPPDVVGQLRSLTRDVNPPITVELTQRRGGERTPGPTITIGEDGRGEVSGLAPGRWDAHLRHAHGRHALASVHVADGETATMAVDLARLRPVTLRGGVRRNGQLVQRQTVLVSRRNESDQERPDEWAPGISVLTDEHGQFAFRGIPGRYRVLLASQTMLDGELASPDGLLLPPGETVYRDFTVTTGTLLLRLVDAQQRPVADVAGLQLLRAAGDVLAYPTPTGEDGTVRLDHCEIGTHRLSVLPKRLASYEAQVALYEANPGDPDVIARHRVDLGIVEVHAGAPAEQTIVLPPTWWR